MQHDDGAVLLVVRRPARREPHVRERRHHLLDPLPHRLAAVQLAVRVLDVVDVLGEQVRERAPVAAGRAALDHGRVVGERGLELGPGERWHRSPTGARGRRPGSPVGPLLVLREVGVEVDQPRPERRALVRRRGPGAHRPVPLALEADRRVRVREQVGVPLRVLRQPALRRDDHEVGVRLRGRAAASRTSLPDFRPTWSSSSVGTGFFQPGADPPLVADAAVGQLEDPRPGRCAMYLMTGRSPASRARRAAPPADRPIRCSASRRPLRAAGGCASRPASASSCGGRARRSRRSWSPPLPSSIGIGLWKYADTSASSPSQPDLDLAERVHPLREERRQHLGQPRLDLGEGRRDARRTRCSRSARPGVKTVSSRSQSPVSMARV